MTSKNVATVMRQFEGFNAHDAQAAANGYTADAVLNDHATALSVKGPAEIMDQVSVFLNAASDGRVAINATYESGNVVIAEITWTGTNDGPLGPLPATGRPVTLDAVDILHFDNEGRIVQEDWYYDQLMLMAQLGHAAAPPQ